MGKKRKAVQGTLVRAGTSWRLEVVGGPNVYNALVEEPDPSRHVGKLRWWKVGARNGFPTLSLDRELSGLSTNLPQSVRTISGGAPGLGRNRRN
jgi:hypothetical protein